MSDFKTGKFSSEKLRDRAVIFYDGECGFCKSWVNYIIERDPQKVFVFCRLNSNIAKDLLGQDRSSQNQSVYLWLGERILDKSSAVLQIARKLKGPTKLLFAFVVVPRFARDWIYDLVAKYRHRMTRFEHCHIATGNSDRFLD